jgi:putative membrane protein
MLRRTLLLLALVLPLTLQAADPVALHEDDAAFIKKATFSGLMEIRSAEAALSRKLTPDEQAFAKQLIADHQKANDELAAIARKKGVTPPSSLGADEQKKLAKMGKIEDEDFNEEWLEHQISCHKDAIDLFEDQADDSKDAELKAFAAKHLPILKGHLETAKRLEDKY